MGQFASHQRSLHHCIVVIMIVQIRCCCLACRRLSRESTVALRPESRLCV